MIAINKSAARPCVKSICCKCTLPFEGFLMKNSFFFESVKIFDSEVSIFLTLRCHLKGLLPNRTKQIFCQVMASLTENQRTSETVHQAD